MSQSIINLIVFPFITIILLFILIGSIKRKKKKWLIILLSFLLVWVTTASAIMIIEFIENYNYPYSEIKIKNQKYYRNGKLFTGVSSFMNNKDSVVLKIKNGDLSNRTIFLSLNKKIEIFEMYLSSEFNNQRFSRSAFTINKKSLLSEESLSEGKLWYMITKDSNRSLNDYVLIYGKPNKIEKEGNRTFYSFLIEEESSECTDKRNFVGKVSFEKPFYYESGCAVNQKLITESKENILSKIKGKYFVARSYGSEIATLEIKYDNTFIMSYKILGGLVTEGTWEIYDGDDVGQANIILYPSPAQVAAGNIAKEIYLVVNETDLSMRVRGSETIYELKK